MGLSGPIILSFLFLAYAILSYLNPNLSNLLSSYPAFSYLILSCPILSYLFLSYPILSYSLRPFFFPSFCNSLHMRIQELRRWFKQVSSHVPTCLKSPRFMIAAWLHRSAFGWSTLYLASGILGAGCWRWWSRMWGGAGMIARHAS